jgi:hypothetical protein
LCWHSRDRCWVSNKGTGKTWRPKAPQKGRQICSSCYDEWISNIANMFDLLQPNFSSHETKAGPRYVEEDGLTKER